MVFIISIPTSTVFTQEKIPVLSYEVVNTYPHDRKAFTQGLVFQDGFLYESTGLYGNSSLRKVELTTGKVLQMHSLPPELFGEGITIYNDQIIQLTWQSKIGLVYDKERFNLIQTFFYPTEGWGITHNQKWLIMSDGSSQLYLLDPVSFKIVKQITVTANNKPVKGINELEYIQGEIFANIWPTNRIARISLVTGKVTAWLDLSGLVPLEQQVDVLNGIAYDEKTGRFFITGKFWPQIFEIKIFNPR